MLNWGQAPFFNIFHLWSTAEDVTDVEMRGLAPIQHAAPEAGAQKIHWAIDPDRRLCTSTKIFQKSSRACTKVLDTFRRRQYIHGRCARREGTSQFVGPGIQAVASVRRE
jgi:hypothetical protein